MVNRIQPVSFEASYFRPIDIKSEDFQNFFRKVLSAIKDIILSNNITSLYLLSDKLLSYQEFQEKLESTKILPSMHSIHQFDKQHFNCMLYPNYPGEPRLSDDIIQTMPFVFYTVNKITDEDLDTWDTELRCYVILFHFSKSSSGYYLISSFRPPMQLDILPG